MFTKREKEVCDLIIEGLTNKEIAKKLIISEHTVKAHKESIYAKLKVHNCVQAAIKYYIYKLQTNSANLPVQ